MNKNKILYNSQNVYELIKDNTEIIEADNNFIFTPSAMDIIKSKGIKIVYKKDIADNCVKDDSTEIVKQTIKILVNKLNITDEKTIKKVITEVLNRVNL